MFTQEKFRKIRFFLLPLTLLTGLAFVLLTTRSVQAASFNVACGDVSGLINAINSANTTSAPDTIILPDDTCTYTLTAINNVDAFGANGLPVITTPITIHGSGKIDRLDTAGIPAFRIFEVAAGGDLTLVITDIQNGRAAGNLAGGGILNMGKLALIGMAVEHNYALVGASGQGGGIYNTGTLTINESTIFGNQSHDGGGIYNNGNLMITFSGVDINQGGGIYNDHGTVTLYKSAVADNLAVEGGGLYNLGGKISLDSSTVKDNVATSTGGGIDNNTNGVLTLVNSTVSGNKAVNGNIIGNMGQMTMKNSTIAHNTASANSSAIENMGKLTLLNSLIVAQVAGADCKNAAPGVITANSHNLDSDGTCGDASTSVNPGLDGLKLSVPGDTETHALLPGSPAIDAGDGNTCTLTDQRGVSRLQGASCDLGAYELITGGSTDKTPPAVTCSVSPKVLTPAHHNLKNVKATVTVSDSGSGPAGFTLLSVTSNEPDSGLDNVDKPNDIQGFTLHTTDVIGQLRAERSNNGSGRIYTLTYQGKDVAGNSANCQATVTVPLIAPQAAVVAANTPANETVDSDASDDLAVEDDASAVNPSPDNPANENHVTQSFQLFLPVVENTQQ